MKKWTLNQGLTIFGSSRHKIILIGNSQRRFIVPKTEEKLLDYLATGLKSEKEIREWMMLNQHQWTFETLIKSGILTEYFTDPNDRNAKEDVFYNLLECGDSFKDEIKSKTVLVVGAGSIGNNMIQCFSRINIKKIIVIDNDVVKTSNLNSQIFFDTEDVNKNKVNTIKEKVKRYSETEIIEIDMHIESERQLELIKNSNQIDFVILAANSDIRMSKWCYDVFSKNGIPVTTCGFIGTLMVSGPILNSKSKQLEEEYKNIDSIHLMNKNFENSIAPASIFMSSYISSYTATEILKFWTKKWKPETYNSRICIDFLEWRKQTFSLNAEKSWQSDEASHEESNRKKIRR